MVGVASSCLASGTYNKLVARETEMISVPSSEVRSVTYIDERVRKRVDERIS